MTTSPFDRTWDVSFGALQGTRAPNVFPFSTNARLRISGSPPTMFSIILTGGTQYDFEVQPSSGMPDQIVAMGEIEGKEIGGIYRFLAYLNTQFVEDLSVLVGIYTWNLLGDPTDDPPDTGGWVGGATNPGTPQRG
jgi:hypothetical protein